MTQGTLDVFIGGVLVGSLHGPDPLSFTYADDCLNGLVAVPFADIIPLQQGAISSVEVTAFFENLLPEGDQRLLLEAKHHVSTVFGLLSEVGGDTAGSVVILPAGARPELDSYAKLNWDDVGKMLANSTAIEGVEPVMPRVGNHVSISGAQNKLLISIDVDGSPLFPLGASISTHILKPDIVRANSSIWASAINETIMMRAAKLCGLPVAEVDYVGGSVKSCLVKRYDRIKDPETERWVRIYQADLCQLLNKPSTVKYENDGGPSFKDCYLMVKAKSALPAVDCLNMLKWLFFNLYTGNNDSHAKNISMMATAQGLRLAPFYDLMCTRVYSGLSVNFAFRIGDSFQAGKVSADDVFMLADSIGVTRKYLLDIAATLATKVEAAVPGAVSQLESDLDYTEKVLAERIMQNVADITKKVRARILLGEH